MSSGGGWEWSGGSYDGIHDDKSASPEERLWMAVIELAVLDFRSLLEHIALEQARSGKTSGQYLWELKKLRYEMQTPWFADICDYIKVHHTTIIKHLDKEAMAIGVDPTKPVLNPGIPIKPIKKAH